MSPENILRVHLKQKTKKKEKCQKIIQIGPTLGTLPCCSNKKQVSTHAGIATTAPVLTGQRWWNLSCIGAINVCFFFFGFNMSNFVVLFEIINFDHFTLGIAHFNVKVRITTTALQRNRVKHRYCDQTNVF